MARESVIREGISMYFTPNHDADLSYYGRKLAKLTEYLRTHDLHEPLSPNAPADRWRNAIGSN